MHEKDSQFPIVNSQGRFECKGIWGGIRNRDIEVAAGKVIGSIYSELKRAVLRALHQYAGKDLTHDDVTMIVLEIC